MLFRQIIFSALFIGLASGLLHSGVQILDVTAIILEAETYEVAEIEMQTSDEHTEAWGPEDGMERTLYTFMANIMSGIGFATILLALMNQFQQQGLAYLNISKGALWGLAGFISFFVAPGLGLAPEIPGTQAALLESRQAWWVMTVLATAISLVVFAFAPVKFKILGVLGMAIPHLIGAPHIEGAEFTDPDPAVIDALTNLHHQFILATGLSNLIFWLALGIACAWTIKRSVVNSYTNG